MDTYLFRTQRQTRECLEKVRTYQGTQSNSSDALEEGSCRASITNVYSVCTSLQRERYTLLEGCRNVAVEILPTAKRYLFPVYEGNRHRRTHDFIPIEISVI